MRYIKTFESHNNDDDMEEKSVQFRQELQKFCDGYLAFLIDDGYSVWVTDRNDYFEFKVRLIKPVKTESNIFVRDPFEWNDVKEDFMPFFEILKEKYFIDSQFGEITFVENLQHKIYSIEEIESDTFEPFNLIEIYIYINGKNE